MTELTYLMNGRKFRLNVSSDTEFKFGDDIVLSNAENDITYTQPWYNEGFACLDALTSSEFRELKNGVGNSLYKIIKNLGIDLPASFKLENYHKFICSDESHLKVVEKTRDLFAGDFNFEVQEYLRKIEKILNLKLTNVNPFNQQKVHIILRINRPNSYDYNPPHKDIYEPYDEESYIPMIVNVWIPICGVSSKTSLPIVPGSHLLSEKQINRTTDGGNCNGNKYRVRLIKSWGESQTLVRADVRDKQVLVFSPHLIHGLGLNEEEDVTRMALEFRLFKKE